MTNFWQALLKFIGFRAQAKAVGADNRDANKAAAIAVAMDEVEKQASKEAEKK